MDILIILIAYVVGQALGALLFFFFTIAKDEFEANKPLDSFKTRKQQPRVMMEDELSRYKNRKL